MIVVLLIIVKAKICKVILIISIPRLIIHLNGYLGILAVYQYLPHNKWGPILEFQWELELPLVLRQKFAVVLKISN